MPILEIGLGSRFHFNLARAAHAVSTQKKRGSGSRWQRFRSTPSPLHYRPPLEKEKSRGLCPFSPVTSSFKAPPVAGFPFLSTPGVHNVVGGIPSIIPYAE